MSGSASFSCVINNKQDCPTLPIQTGLSHPSSTNRIVPPFQYKQDCPIISVQTGLSHPSSTNRIVPPFQYKQDCPIISVQTGLSHHFSTNRIVPSFQLSQERGKFTHGACMYRKQQQKKPFNVTNTFWRQSFVVLLFCQCVSASPCCASPTCLSPPPLPPPRSPSLCPLVPCPVRIMSGNKEQSMDAAVSCLQFRNLVTNIV